MDSNVPPENCLEYECFDRISNMPDSILGKILSYVATKDAVAASILSTRWRNLFPFALTHIKLDLNDFKPLSQLEQIYLRSPSLSFMNFVDKLFHETLLSVQYVDRISIRCDGDYGEEKIVSWLHSALRLKVVYFCLFCKLNNSESLFHSLNGCTSLVELELGSGSNFEFCVPEDFVLPNLKKVSLHSLIIRDDTDSVHTLLSCPMLEHLTLNSCVWAAHGFLYIKSSVLKRLFIMRCRGDEVQIDAPKLEDFLYTGNVIVYFAMDDSKLLRLAIIEFVYMDFYFEDFYSIGTLVKGCSSTICLYLSGRSIMALVRQCVQLPMFMNLTSLVLGLLKGHEFEILARLLNNAANLQTLTIEEGFENCEGGYASFESSLPSLPECLKLCFKKIEIREFKGEEDGIKLIEYFLKNGRMLREVRVIYLPIVDMGVFDRIIVIPKHSKNCEIFLMEKGNRILARSFANWF